MAYLILQHLPEPAAGIIQGAVIIGRKAGHAIVVDDPSVSRRHAKIVKDGRAYFISDMDSRTGTRINGRSIDREKLRGGDEITIGPAKIIFKRGLNLPANMKRIRLHAHGRFRKETSERRHFDCPCGKQIEVALPLESKLAKCGWCHQIVIIPDASEAARVEKSAISGSTETCSVCLTAMTPAEEILACPECGLRFHAECWAENRGCSAYGCAQVGVLDQKSSPGSGSIDAESVAVAEDLSDTPGARPIDSILSAAASVARGWRGRSRKASRSEVGEGGADS